MQYAHAQWEYLEAGLKFYVDEGLRHIVFAPETTEINITVDLYKGLKTWYNLLSNSNYAFPVRTIGGDSIGGGQSAGDMYFMINNYRVVYDPTKVKVTGILFSDDYDTAWLYNKTLEPVYPASVSNLALSQTTTTNVVTGTALTAQETADAVWQATVRTLTEQSTLIASQAAQLENLFRLAGLDIDNPMTVTETSRVAGDIDLVISGDGETTSTVTRTPTIFNVVDEIGNLLVDELENEVIG